MVISRGGTHASLIINMVDFRRRIAEKTVWTCNLTWYASATRRFHQFQWILTNVNIASSCAWDIEACSWIEVYWLYYATVVYSPIEHFASAFHLLSIARLFRPTHSRMGRINQNLTTREQIDQLKIKVWFISLDWLSFAPERTWRFSLDLTNPLWSILCCPWHTMSLGITLLNLHQEWKQTLLKSIHCLFRRLLEGRIMLLTTRSGTTPNDPCWQAQYE